MIGRRRAGIASLGIGLALVLGVRLVPGLGGPPLYDGVVPVPPYQWLTPGAGQQGGAQGATATIAVNAGKNDLLAIATQESIPQAQVLATPGSLVLERGATSLNVAITPVAPADQPTDGTLAGNVYRFDVKDQNGVAATARAAAKVSIVLRSADATLVTGVVERWNGSGWVRVSTAPPQANGAYLVVVTEFGDYAVVQPNGAATPGASKPPAGSSSAGTSASSPSPTATAGDAVSGDGSGGPGIVFPIAIAALVAGLAFAAMVVVGRRSAPAPASDAAPPEPAPRSALGPPARPKAAKPATPPNRKSRRG